MNVRPRHAMTKVPEQFAVSRKLLDAVAPIVAVDPDVAVAVYENRMLGAGTGARDALRRPSLDVVRLAP